MSVEQSLISTLPIAEECHNLSHLVETDATECYIELQYSFVWYARMEYHLRFRDIPGVKLSGRCVKLERKRIRFCIDVNSCHAKYLVYEVNNKRWNLLNTFGAKIPTDFGNMKIKKSTRRLNFIQIILFLNSHSFFNRYLSVLAISNLLLFILPFKIGLILWQIVALSTAQLMSNRSSRKRYCRSTSEKYSDLFQLGIQCSLILLLGLWQVLTTSESCSVTLYNLSSFLSK